MNGVVHVDRRYEAEGINQPHGPEKRADGGAMHHKGGKGKIGAVNIAIKAGGGQAEKQMAAQKGLQAGIQIGARQAAAKMGGAPAGGPPPGGMPPGAMPPGPMAGPPPGAAPPGGMMPGPGPMRPPGGMAGGPPPGAMPPPHPPGMMAKRGGHIKHRDEGGSISDDTRYGKAIPDLLRSQETMMPPLEHGIEIQVRFGMVEFEPTMTRSAPAAA